MATLKEEQLQEILKKFSGKQIDIAKQTHYKQFSLAFFSDINKIPNPQVEVTSQLDITQQYETYLAHYSQSKGASFTAYIKWNFLKAIKATPAFTWRYINGQWYEFSNLPLEVSVITQDYRQQLLYFLYDVIDSPWEEFCARHAALKAGTQKDALADIAIIPIHAFALEIVGIHFPRMTSYKMTQKECCRHQPWIIFGDRYSEGDRLYLPVHIAFSHASLTPNLVSQFIDKFLKLVNLTPAMRENLDLGQKQEQNLMAKL